MKRELILLGTGSAMVTKCYNTCFALHFCDEFTDEYFLVDAGGGNGILAQLEKAKIDICKIHNMFITHAHTDHILGVVWVIRKVASLLNQGKYKGKFNIYCHDESKKIVEAIIKMTLKKKDLAQVGKNIIIHEVEDATQVEFMAMQMQVIFFDIFSKKAKQFGFCAEFEEDGLTVCCLGDEPYNEMCGIYAEGSNWLLSEAFCLYADRDIFKPYEKHHSTVKEASQTAEQLGVEHLVLYHTEDTDIPNRKEKYTNEAREYYYGDVQVPDDLERIQLY